MNQSLEKIVFIGLNLIILTSIGLPLLFSTTQVLNELEHQLVYHKFIDEVDESILLAYENRIDLTRSIEVPPNLTISAESNQLVFRFFYNSWHVTSRSYQCMINVEGPIISGPHLLTINATDTIITIRFQLA